MAVFPGSSLRDLDCNSRMANHIARAVSIISFGAAYLGMRYHNKLMLCLKNDFCHSGYSYSLEVSDIPGTFLG
jgi:hypothetical protein